MTDAIRRIDAAWRRMRRGALRKLASGKRGRKTLIDMMDPAVLAVTLDCGDHRLSFSPHELIGRRIFAHGDFDRDNVRQVIAILAERGLLDERRRAVLELGANIGTQTVYFCLSERFDKIVSVEPDPRNLMLLRRNVVENGFGGLVEIIEAAAGDSDGSIELFRSHGNHGDSSIVRSRHDAGSITVPMRRVDEIVSTSDIGPQEIALVWMDIEGAEPAACRSMAELMAARVPIMMEYSPLMYGAEGHAEFRAFLASFYDDAMLFRRGQITPIKVADIPDGPEQFDLLLLP
ncbi:FkbM family methyltransferase [Pararhizobium haloflavum]|uniref:FkbM family methyltransferase n=1 Tax=Pararhizobium haloflavum TaxID=2037914 RepID=UPI000C176270|nr:FkbM family methyltransferase [Pararhizobium haloflavum]